MCVKRPTLKSTVFEKFTKNVLFDFFSKLDFAAAADSKSGKENYVNILLN